MALPTRFFKWQQSSAVGVAAAAMLAQRQRQRQHVIVCGSKQRTKRSRQHTANITTTTSGVSNWIACAAYRSCVRVCVCVCGSHDNGIERATRKQMQKMPASKRGRARERELLWERNWKRAAVAAQFKRAHFANHFATAAHLRDRTLQILWALSLSLKRAHFANGVLHNFVCKPEPRVGADTLVVLLLLFICVCVCGIGLYAKALLALVFFLLLLLLLLLLLGAFLYGKREMRIYLEGFKLLAPR